MDKTDYYGILTFKDVEATVVNGKINSTGFTTVNVSGGNAITQEHEYLFTAVGKR